MNDHKTEPPIDQLAAVIEVMAVEASKECTSTSENIQPKMVSELVSTAVQKWSSVITDLCDKLSSSHAFMGVITSSVMKVAAGHLPTCTERTQETIAIGILLCLRDNIDPIADNDILSGCKKLPACGVAMKAFIKFLDGGS